MNALSDDMVSRLIELFLVYQQDAKVKLVILKGEGRAFCAGGDVAAIARLLFVDDWRTAFKIIEKLYSNKQKTPSCNIFLMELWWELGPEFLYMVGSVLQLKIRSLLCRKHLWEVSLIWGHLISCQDFPDLLENILP